MVSGPSTRVCGVINLLYQHRVQDLVSLYHVRRRLGPERWSEAALGASTPEIIWAFFLTLRFGGGVGVGLHTAQPMGGGGGMTSSFAV